MELSENYRSETIGRGDCRPIVRLSANTIVRWDYRLNPNYNFGRREPTFKILSPEFRGNALYSSVRDSHLTWSELLMLPFESLRIETVT